MVELLSTNPAKIYGLYPQKGTIEVGSDADLVVLNPNKTKVIKAENQVQNVDYTPYENYRLNCEIERDYLRGKEVSRNGKIIDNFPTGKYLKRSSN